MSEAGLTQAAKKNGREKKPDRMRERPSSSANPLFADLLGLQDTAGNHAVSSMMQTQPITTPSDQNSLPADVQSLLNGGGGTPLDDATRTFMESRFNHDFSQVRIHSNSLAEKSADALDANAYAIGNSIVFGAGRYRPHTTGGNRLLAHELAHVVQQRQGGAVPETGHAAHAESEAAAVAGQIAAGQSSVSVSQGTGIGIARDPKDPTGLPAATPEDLWRMVQGLRGHDASEPAHSVESAKERTERAKKALAADPDNKKLQKALKKAQNQQSRITRNQTKIDPTGKGKPIGTGYNTYAAIQVVDANGKQVAVGIGKFDGKVHAEEHAMNHLRTQLKGKKVANGRLMVVVDQKVCGSCRGKLKAFAKEFGIKKITAHLPTRTPVGKTTGEVSPKTAARTSVQKDRETKLKTDTILDETPKSKAGKKTPPPTTSDQPKGKKPVTQKPVAKKAAVPKTPKSAKKVSTKPKTIKPKTIKPKTIKPKTSFASKFKRIRLPRSGRLRSMGRGLAGAVAGLLLQWLMAKWMAEIEAEIVQDQIEKLQPDVEAKLQKALEAKSDELVQLFQENPDADIYINISFELHRFQHYDQYGTIESLPIVEIGDVGFTRTPVSDRPRLRMETVACIQQVEVETLTMSDKVPVKELFE